MPVCGKSESVETSQFPADSEPFPVGGVWILEIRIENRAHGFRLTIKTDEVTIVIDIP